MNCFKIPKYMCKKINNINMDFFWNKNKGEKEIVNQLQLLLGIRYVVRYVKYI